jgi:hypothetical protein
VDLGVSSFDDSGDSPNNSETDTHKELFNCVWKFIDRDEPTTHKKMARRVPAQPLLVVDV